jgi:hypothetical protein
MLIEISHNPGSIDGHDELSIQIFVSQSDPDLDVVLEFTESSSASWAFGVELDINNGDSGIGVPPGRC